MNLLLSLCVDKCSAPNVFFCGRIRNQAALTAGNLLVTRNPLSHISPAEIDFCTDMSKVAPAPRFVKNKLDSLAVICPVCKGKFERAQLDNHILACPKGSNPRSVSASCASY